MPLSNPSLVNRNDDNHHLHIPFAFVTDHLSTNGSEWFWVDIVSATYAPCEEMYAPQHCFQCPSNSINSTTTPVPFTPPHLTRDVTPLVRALLIQQETETSDIHNAKRFANDETMSMTTLTSTTRWIRLPAVQSGQRRVQISLLAEHAALESDTALMSMGLNGLFGDPAPGLSKRLHIVYRIREDDPVMTLAMDTKRAPMCSTVNFAEHERVYLRHGYWTSSSCSSSNSTTTSNGSSAAAAATATTMSNSPTAGTERATSRNDPTLGDNALVRIGEAAAAAAAAVANTFWLPWILPFLPVRQRVQCRLVCRAWQHVIAEWGIAVAITDTDYIPVPSNNVSSTSAIAPPTTPSLLVGWTSTVLRGLLSHSFASLQRLFLSHSPDLQPDDLHFAIPHLRKLQTLDISRCVLLDDATLQLLADCVPTTLEVLYIKGLAKVSDRGVTAIAQACRRLKVLDLSYLTALTDQSMLEIGRHLTQLRAIYLRENYHVTNASINVLTESCTSLEQLTLWGSIRLDHLRFPSPHDQPSAVPSRLGALLSSTTGGRRLVLLNLWGCHSLRDDAAQSLIGMTHLRTLIVSECHLLTDNFVVRCLYPAATIQM
jgi:hypothetical protein